MTGTSATDVEFFTKVTNDFFVKHFSAQVKFSRIKGLLLAGTLASATRSLLWTARGREEEEGEETGFDNISHRDTILCHSWQKINRLFFCTELALCQKRHAKSSDFTSEFMGGICIQTVASMIVWPSFLKEFFFAKYEYVLEDCSFFTKN